MIEDSYSLLEYLLGLQNCIKQEFPSSMWVKGEINSVSLPASGHCYLSLVERDASGKVVAEIKANVWSRTFEKVRDKFERVSGFELGVGVEILVRVTAGFHLQYGLSVVVEDIDPSYTSSKMRDVVLEVYKKLQDDGVASLNKEQEIPYFIRNIAIISSESAAGYEDFVSHLKEGLNGVLEETGLRNIHKSVENREIINKSFSSIELTLYPSLVQGDKAPSSIIDALDKIDNDSSSGKKHFDIVVIIRGGGGKSDLVCFNDYNLSSYVAQFPLPILSGVGHDRDSSVVDMVANKNFKTPTAVADFIIDNHLQIISRVVNYQIKIKALSKSFVEKIYFNIETYKYQIKSKAEGFKNSLLIKVEEHRGGLRDRLSNFKYKEFRKLDAVSSKLSLLESRLEDVILLYNKEFKIIESVNDIQKDEEFSVRLKDGEIKVKALEIIKGNKKMNYRDGK